MCESIEAEELSGRPRRAFLNIFHFELAEGEAAALDFTVTAVEVQLF